MPDASDRLLPNAVPRRRFFTRRGGAPAPGPKVSDRRSDLMVAGLGIVLGLSCAMFPWYIFFNQEKFRPEGMDFKIVPGLGNGPATLTPAVMRADPLLKGADVPIEQLDLFATGTTPDEPEKPQAADAAEQPLPAPAPVFRIVHIENGRAMVEDDGGLYVVGRGDRLPDGSTVEKLEERDGKSVLITSKNAVLEPAE